jgi:hypothetical protein
MFFQTLLNRLKEPSTWAGLASVAALMPVPGASAWQQIAGGIAALLAVGIPESKG